MSDKISEDDRRVLNESMTKDFMLLSGETWRWKNLFRKSVSDRPFWSGNTKMCMGWHAKGNNCFNDCQGAAIHIPAEYVPHKKKYEFKKFLKMVRQC